MGAPEQNPALFRLPSVFVRTAETLGRHFNLPAQYLVACLPAVVGTAAGGCRLETDIWSQAISPALDLAFCLPEDERLRTAVGHILKPLREIQGQYWSTLQAREVVGNQARPPAPEWDPQPPVLLDNPAAGQLAETARQSQGSPMLVLYDEAGWQPIVKAARSRAKIDLVLLQRGWEGQSCAAPESGGIAGDLSVGCLALCWPTSWSRALTSKNALLAKLASQFLLMDAAPNAKEFRPQRFDLTRSLRPWRELIYRIVEACYRTGKNPIRLSPEAYQLLIHFWRQNMGEGAWLTPEAKLFQRNVALIAVA